MHDSFRISTGKFVLWNPGISLADRHLFRRA
jgi:hypothetical protein